MSITASQPMSATDVSRALARADGDLTVDDAVALLGARGRELEDVLDLAGALRDRGLERAGRAGIVTYSRKVFLPLTTLCRDRCHYCVFVDTPGQLLKKGTPAYMSDQQILAVARHGAALGCREALLTLGDRPEERWPQARAWLDAQGFSSTLEYVAHAARLVTEETGLLAHANPGVLSRTELREMRRWSPSMGMMLETTSERLFREPGQVHHGSPDKEPAVRLAVIEDAGRERIPFTTGILVGIGETVRDRAESLLALRDAHRRHGHLQEIIVQNFRAKPRTAMQGAPDADRDAYVAAVATARLVFGADARIQVPPNLSDPMELDLLLRAGADDWGGVSPLTADHVNPERPWPQLDDLAARTAELGFALRERLTAHPEYVAAAETWIDAGLRPAVVALADPATGLAGRQAPSRPRGAPRHGALAARAVEDPEELDDAEWAELLRSGPEELERLVAGADEVRRYTVGEAITLVVNRNLTSSGYLAGDAEGSFSPAEAGDIAADAAGLGATELCVQGRLRPDVDPEGYLDLVREVRRRAPRLHLHAYRPQDVADLADRTGWGVPRALAELRAAGVDTMPGTGVKVLSERVRGLIAPDDLETDRWAEIVAAAHRAGFATTSVLFYGHVETAEERIGHLRRLRAMQAETGGFREFVPIPLPGPRGGVPLVPGREPVDEHRAMVAVSRLLLTRSIPHVQVPWPRVGRETAALLLQAGGDDLGGALLDGRVRPDAGIEAGQELPPADAERIAARLFRPFRQRNTDYTGVAPAPRRS